MTIAPTAPHVPVGLLARPPAAAGVRERQRS